jgi:hypothetical protein
MRIIRPMVANGIARSFFRLFLVAIDWSSKTRNGLARVWVVIKEMVNRTTAEVVMLLGRTTGPIAGGQIMTEYLKSIIRSVYLSIVRR